jgi:hypothetical protein
VKDGMRLFNLLNLLRSAICHTPKKTLYICIQEEEYLMRIREKQIQSLNRKIISLKIQPHELAL